MNIVTAKRQHSKSSSCVCSCKFASGSGSISYNSLVQPPSINSDYECHCKKIEAPIKVLVTGAAGQIAYILVGLLAKGNAFGSNQPIILHLLDIPQMEENLRGVAMELIDLASSILVDVIPTTDITVAFRDIDVAFLVGSMPRRVGMERRDLLAANVKIFKSQGSALEQYAKRTVKVLVVGNPANTNALMCSKYAPSIPKENFAAMTRLDHNRATSLIANRLRIPANCVRNVIIWGNHSTTQYPDVHHAVARIGDKDKPVYSAVVNDEYLQGEFITTVQKRGAAVISARKLSSAMSAANAATQCLHDWWLGTEPGTWVSMAVYSDGSYGAPSEVMYSFPVICGSDHSWRIVQGLPIDDFSREKMDLSGKELLEERNEALMVCKD